MMLPQSLVLLLPMLSFAGGAAVLRRLAGAVLRAGLAAAETSAASALASASAARGDLTAMAEQTTRGTAARRRRRNALVLMAGWTAVFVVPLVAGYGREVLAAAAVLWLLPRARRATKPR